MTVTYILLRNLRNKEISENQNIESSASNSNLFGFTISNFTKNLFESRKTFSNITQASKDLIEVVPVEKPDYTIKKAKPLHKFDSHEGDVNAVKFPKNGKYFATGGGDKKIKIWEYKDGNCELKSSLIGSTGSILSIDINSEVS